MIVDDTRFFQNCRSVDAPDVTKQWLAGKVTLLTCFLVLSEFQGSEVPALCDRCLKGVLQIRFLRKKQGCRSAVHTG